MKTVEGIYLLERETEDGEVLSYDIPYRVHATGDGFRLSFTSVEFDEPEDIELTQEEIERLDEAAKDHARDLIQSGYV